MKNSLPNLLSRLVLLSLFVLAGLARAETEALARVGDTEIKVEEVRPLLQGLSPREQAALAKDPTLLNQFVRSLIVQRLVLKEAVSKKWDQQPAVIAELEHLREDAIAQSYLRSVSKVPDNYPSDSDLQEAYQAGKASLLVPKQFRLAQIFVALPKGADKATADAAQVKVDAVRTSLGQPNANFSAIAQAQSEEKESAARGGEIGWLVETQIQPEIRTAAGSLAKDAVSSPVRLDDGWHIIKVLEVKDSYTPSFEEVKQPLAQQLRAARLKANSDAYLNQLLQENRVAINELALAQLLPKAEKK